MSRAELPNEQSQQEGVIALLSLMLISVIAVGILATVSGMTLSGYNTANALTASERTFYAAESGIQEGLYRLIHNPIASSFTLDVDGIEINVTIEADGFTRRITSTATDASSISRSLSVVARSSSYGGGLDFALQTGVGGILMENNSSVDGHIYTSGDILGDGGNCNNRVILGDAVAADISIIEGVRVQSDSNGNYGNAFANTIRDSCIDTDAYYQVLENTSVGGNVHPGSSNPEVLPLPIDMNSINEWKSEIDILNPVPVGPSAPGVCPNQSPYDLGTYYCIMSDTTLSNQKIEADLFIKGDITITLTGNIWATGKIIFENAGSGLVRLDAAQSKVIIADDIIDLSNNYTIESAGNDEDFITLVTTSDKIIGVNGATEPAIFASNGSASIILAAPLGEIRVKNGGSVNASVAHKIHLLQTSTVIYNQNLESYVIFSGDSHSLEVVPDSWQEL